MTTFQSIIILSIVISVVFIWISISFSKENKLNIEKFKPTIFPVINPFFIFRDGIALAGLAFMLTSYSTILSDNPIVFIPIGILINGSFLYYVYKKNIFSYYTETKIILWNPGLFNSSFGEVDLNNVEALIFASNDGISQVMSKTGKKIYCSININIDGQKKSFGIDIEKYDIEKLKDYFNKNNKPIYTKIHYEKTAKRIN